VNSPVSRRINAERIVLLGWGRAILLQLAHPLVAAGVFDHSGFRDSPSAAVVRLHRTVRAMLGLSFGNPQERDAILDHIRTIHRRVHGSLPETTGPFPAGAPYSAEDPALVLWVHATIVESMVLAYERLVEALTDVDRDAYCADAAPVAVALGARDDDVPRTWAGIEGYIDGMYKSGAIVVSTQARALGHAVLEPAGAWVATPLTWINKTVTMGLLPSTVRAQFGLSWTRREQRQFDRVLPALRAMRHVLPHVVVLWPEARR